MKIALCLSGLLRSLDYTYASHLEYILKPLNPDVFIFTWGDYTDQFQYQKERRKWIGFCGFTRKRFGYKEEGVKRFSEESPKGLDGLVQEQFKPISCQIAKYAALTPLFKTERYNTHKYPGTQVERVLAMYYGIKQVNALKKQTEEQLGFRYDLVIRSRFDLQFNAHLPEIVLKPTARLWVPNAHQDFHGVNDQFAIGTSKLMDAYAGVYDRIPHYFEQGVLFNPEVLLKHHLETEKIPLKRFEWDYVIHRGRVEFEEKARKHLEQLNDRKANRRKEKILT